MTTYYVSPSGSDANNGLGPDASHASNKPWLTRAKAYGAAGAASGDLVHFAPGSYRAADSVAMTSPTVDTIFRGDPGNAQGFKDGSGVLLPPGDVIWTAYTTNDTSAPSASTLLTLAGRDFLTFENIVMVGGSAAAPSIISAVTTHARNITFRRIAFLNVAVAQTINYVGLADEAANWLIEQCVFLTFNNAAINITLPTSTVADFDSNFIIQNCLFIQLGSTAINVTASGAAAFKGGGVVVKSCEHVGTASLLQANSANLSTTIPCLAYNNKTLVGSGASLNANTSGQILSEYNRRLGSATLTNVTAGTGDVSGNNQAPLLEVGQSIFMGRMLRPFLSPMANSPLLGFGSNGAPSVDFANRPRPAGGASLLNAVGYLERHDAARVGASLGADAGGYIELVGPGDHDFPVPVDATSTTITIKVKWDATHADTNKPQAILLPNGAIGVSTETKTATGTAGSGYETLTFSAFTPTAKGTVTIRLVSRAAAGGGIAAFDTMTGGASGSQGFDYFKNSEPFPALVSGAAAAGGLIGGGTLTGGTQ